MPRLFHQNMLNFGGGREDRNQLYFNAFHIISNAIGPDFLAAGFTEITNSKPKLNEQLLTLSRKLDPGLNKIALMQVGTTLVGGEKAIHEGRDPFEYIGIAWKPALLTVEHGGMVHPSNCTVHNFPYTQTQWPQPAVLSFPEQEQWPVDQRAPAYIAAHLGGNNTRYIIAFMHNTYKLGTNSTYYQRLQEVARAIRAKLGGLYAAAPVVVGGDFNVLPRDLLKRRGDDLPLMYARAAMANDRPVNTTQANPFDFWLVSDHYNDTALPQNPASVHIAPRVLRASDHAAIMLRVT